MSIVDLLSKKEAADFVGVTRSTFDQWIVKYNVPCLKKGRIYFFKKEDLLLIKETGRVGRS